jgi:hypothetical protein
MDPGFVSDLSRIDLPPLTCVAKDIYPSFMGSLPYAAVYTRPNVPTALSILGSALAHPTEVHRQALKKVIRYLKGTIQMRMSLGGGDRSQPPTHRLRRCRLGKRQQHTQVPLGLFVHTRPRACQLQV